LRVRGLADDGTGGLGEDICAEIIAAARGAILRWRSRTAPAPAVLPHEVLADMMRINTGEEIPAGYGAIIAAGLGQDEASRCIGRTHSGFRKIFAFRSSEPASPDFARQFGWKMQASPISSSRKTQR
jgi:hypothetical protein